MAQGTSGPRRQRDTSSRSHGRRQSRAVGTAFSRRACRASRRSQAHEHLRVFHHLSSSAAFLLPAWPRAQRLPSKAATRLSSLASPVSNAHRHRLPTASRYWTGPPLELHASTFAMTPWLGAIPRDSVHDATVVIRSSQGACARRAAFGFVSQMSNTELCQYRHCSKSPSETTGTIYVKRGRSGPDPCLNCPRHPRTGSPDMDDGQKFCPALFPTLGGPHSKYIQPVLFPLTARANGGYEDQIHNLIPLV